MAGTFEISSKSLISLLIILFSGLCAGWLNQSQAATHTAASDYRIPDPTLYPSTHWSSLKSAPVAPELQRSVEQSPATIRVLFLYEQDLEARYGELWLEQRAQKLLNATNATFAANGINGQLNLAGIAASRYGRDSSNAGDAFDDHKSHINYDFTHGYYQAFAPDVIALLIKKESSDYTCGVAYVAPYHARVAAFTVIAFPEYPQAPCGDDIVEKVFSHEVGHLLGSGHEGSESKYAPDSEPYTCGGQRTLMWSQASINGHDFFSDPNLKAGGEACGVAGAFNNARAFNDTVWLLADKHPEPVYQTSVSLADDSDRTMEEGATISITLQRSGELTFRSQIDWAIEHLSTSPEDLTGDQQAGTVVFAPGQASAEINISSFDDLHAEDGEAFRFYLRKGSGDNLEVGERSQVRVVIAASDNDVPVVEFDRSELDVEETANTHITLRLNRSGNSQAAFELNWQLQYESADSDDLIDQPEQGRLSFTTGQQQQALTFALRDDTIAEPLETFVIRLHPSASSEYALGNHSEIRIRIAASDQSSKSPGHQPSEPASSSGGGGAISWLLLAIIALIHLAGARKK